VLEMNGGVQLQAVVDLIDRVWRGFEDVVDVMSSIGLAGVGVSEFLPANLLDLVELGAFFFHLASDSAHKIINAGFTPLCV
jgi:hypothetical protein